jgi:hypothetical protein
MSGPTAAKPPTLRDLYVRSIDENGRTNRQKAVGYKKRAKVEAAMSRYTRFTEDTLK